MTIKQVIYSYNQFKKISAAGASAVTLTGIIVPILVGALVGLGLT